MHDDAHPIKISTAAVRSCKLPPLTALLVDRMARSGYEAMADLCSWMAVAESWERNENLRDEWRAAVKAMYAVLALDAGAKPEGLKGGLN